MITLEKPGLARYTVKISRRLPSHGALECIGMIDNALMSCPGSNKGCSIAQGKETYKRKLKNLHDSAWHVHRTKTEFPSPVPCPTWRYTLVGHSLVTGCVWLTSHAAPVLLLSHLDDISMKISNKKKVTNPPPSFPPGIHTWDGHCKRDEEEEAEEIWNLRICGCSLEKINLLIKGTLKVCKEFGEHIIKSGVCSWL